MRQPPPSRSRRSPNTRSCLPRKAPLTVDLEAPRGFAPHRYLRSIHLKHPRVAARRALPGHHPRSGKKAEFHQTARILDRQVDLAQYRFVAAAQVHEARRQDFRSALLPLSCILISVCAPLKFLSRCRSPGLRVAFFTPCPQGAKYSKIVLRTMKRACYIRPFRMSDLDAVLAIERASFGADAYDRN